MSVSFRRGRKCGAWRDTLPASVAVLLLVAAGCDDERSVTFPESGSGTIEGYVTDGLPIDPSDVYVSVSDYHRDDIDFQIRVRPDSTGYYVMTVPNGPALVQISVACGRNIYHRRDGLTYDANAADSVMVAGQVCRVDFPCGRVAVDVGVPPELQGESLRCGLVHSSDYPWSFSGCTFAVGERLVSEFRLVKPDIYRLMIRDSAFGSAYLPATLDSTTAAPIVVRAGEEALHTSEIPALTVLSGSVTGSWQTFGFDPPRLRVWHDDRQVNEVEAEADGSFDVRLLAGGSLQLVVEIGGVPGYVGGVDLATATVFDLALGEQRTGIDHVESGLELSFQDCPDADLAYYFDIYDASGRVLNRLPGSSQRSYGSTNPARIPNLPPGVVYVYLARANTMATWLPQFYDRRDSLAIADPVTVPPGGQIGQATVTLERGGRILGRLFGVGGVPCPPYEVGLRVYSTDDSTNPVIWYYAMWDDFYDFETGSYVVNGLPDGAYKLSARHSGGLSHWYPDGVDWDRAGVVVIENHADVVLDDWRLPY
jgi:hypothetical protein